MNADTGLRRVIDTAPLGPGELRPWALDADGTVAFAIDRSGSFEPLGTELGIAPADGSAPRIIARPGIVRALDFAAGRVAAVVRPATVSDALGEHRITTFSPADGTARVLARGGPIPALDAAGARVSYSSLACYPARFAVWTQPAADGGGANVARRTCPLALDDLATVFRGRRIRYDVECPTLVPTRPRERCAISVRARIGRRDLGRRRSGTMGAGDSAALHWAVPAAARGARRMRVTVSVTMRGRVIRGARNVRLIRTG